MKNWNTHAWYVTGILAVLFVGSISVQWNAVKDLPGIISFALGLSSLLLAIFAIIQSITSGSSAETSLSSVREASSGVLSTLGDIKIATQELRVVSGTMLQSSEAGRQEVAELRMELTKKSTAEKHPAENNEGMEPEVHGDTIIENSAKGILIDRLTYGSAGAVYLAIMSYRTKKSFKIKEVFPGDLATSYETGVLEGLRLTGFIGRKIRNGRTTITKYHGNIDTDIEDLKNAEFENTKEPFEKRIELIDKYFRENNADAADAAED